MSALAELLVEYVGIDLARPAAWALSIAATALLAGVGWLIVNGG